MNRKFLSFGWLFLCMGQALAQQPAATLPASNLLKCGDETVVIFEDTTSKDGHYALGWTIRPNRKKEPVDWSAYNPDDREAFYTKYSFSGDDGDMEKQDYRVMDGVLDLTARKFTPYPSPDPYFPGKNHWGISVAWSEDQGVARYALAAVDERFDTAELWLITINPSGTRVKNLSPSPWLASVYIVSYP